MFIENEMRIGISENAGTDYVISEKEIGDRDLRSTVTIIGSKPSDAGEYVCLARNNVTYVQVSGFLEVYGSLILIYASVHIYNTVYRAHITKTA